MDALTRERIQRDIIAIWLSIKNSSKFLDGTPPKLNNNKNNNIYMYVYI